MGSASQCGYTILAGRTISVPQVRLRTGMEIGDPLRVALKFLEA